MGSEPAIPKGNGPIERIVISCVTFDTVKITDPIEHYDATKVYLLNYSRDGTNYFEYFNRVLEILDERFDTTVHMYKAGEGKDENEKSGEENIDSEKKTVCTGSGMKKVRKLQIENVNEAVYDFQIMLKTVFSIMNEERASDPKSRNPIYVNITAGTSEFSAAALIASTMFENITVFSVPTVEHTINDDNQKLYYDENGKFIGLAKVVGEPRPINSFSIPRPDRNEILSLRLYHELKFPTAAKVIGELKEKGLWNHPDGDLPNEKMRFQRQFIDKWMSDGLVQREGRGKYSLTDNGRFMIDTYYVNEKKPEKDAADTK